MQAKCRKNREKPFSKPKEIIAQKHKKNDYLPRFLYVGDLLKCSIAVRLASVFFVQTSFVPDEYWQSVEIAHLQVFGYGYKTWEWIEGIRSYLYPSVFALTFYLLKSAFVDTAVVLIIAPRLIQACITAVGDVYLFLFAKRLFEDCTALYAFTLQLTSWFVFYTGSRTLTNTAEMALLIIGLGSHNWHFFTSSGNRETQYESLILSLTCCGLSCIIRPTAAVIWLPILAVELYYQIIHKKSLTFLLTSIATAFVLFFITTVLDFIFYGKIIIVHWNFFRFNVLDGMSEVFGRYPWYWYVTQGIPVVTFTSLPLLVFAVYTRNAKDKNQLSLLFVSFLFIFVLSFISHKEFRFLLPCLPLFNCVAAQGFSNLVKEYKDPDEIQTFKQYILQKIKARGLILFSVMAVANVTLSLYTGLVHQRGTIDVMGFLRNDLKEKRLDADVLFLMPCHSTPYYSQLHLNVTMKFLECHPSPEPDYIDEADLFYANSTKWLHLRFGKVKKPIPTHVILFNSLLKDTGVKKFLAINKFTESLLSYTFPRRKSRKSRGCVLQKCEINFGLPDSYNEDFVLGHKSQGTAEVCYLLNGLLLFPPIRKLCETNFGAMVTRNAELIFSTLKSDSSDTFDFF